MRETMFEGLDTLLEEKHYRALSEALSHENPADTAEYLEHLDEKNAGLVFRLLKKEESVEVFSFLQADLQEKLVADIGDGELSYIIEELSVDDAVDFIEELPAHLVKRVLSTAKPQKRELINRFLNYPQDCAGSVMTSGWAELHENMTVTEAIAHIRTQCPDRESLYVLYVIDRTRHLVGVLDFLDLLYAEPHEKIGSIMERNVISVLTTDDREYVASQIAKYDFLAMPVVDREGRLVGIVTMDDALDVVTEEATEDIEKMAALHPSDAPYLKTGVFSLYKNRIVWLLFLMLSGMITGAVLGQFEAAIAAVPLLVTFIPMLMDTGGNAGAQSAVLVIRGMSLSEISAKDWLCVLWKELRVSLLVGVTLAALNYLRVVLFYPEQPEIAGIALTLALSMMGTVVLAKTVGCLLPIAAKKCRLDPAVMASPVVTTVADTFSILLYFGIATLILF